MSDMVSSSFFASKLDEFVIIRHNYLLETSLTIRILLTLRT